jgi:pterin-4a-carbinolamine dehydratase
METTQKTQIDYLNNEFKKLHSKLLDKKEFAIADELSEIYHKVQFANYKQGIEFIKNLYKL